MSILTKSGLIITFLIITISLITYLLNTAAFGKKPQNQRLERIKKSPNYKNGKFQNRFPTSILPEGYSMIGEVYKTFIKHTPKKSPSSPLVSTKTNLKTLKADSNILVWFGHSSYYMQLNGLRYLIDPVFSGSASPLPIGVKSFQGTDIYSEEDFPEIDYLLITHDHFDHLDYKTIISLKPKIKHIICGLGVGEHFEYWGFDNQKIIEKDWDETIKINTNTKIHTATAKHGSGRGISTDNTLWLSFILESKGTRIFLGGDSGYDVHFKELGQKYGEFDLAILDCGQYGQQEFATIHMSPQYTIQAAKDLNAKALLPVHHSKFVLSRHPWDEPLISITQQAEDLNFPIYMPIIGQIVALNNNKQTFSKWWENID